MNSHPIFTDGELDQIVAFSHSMGAIDWKRVGSAVYAESGTFTLRAVPNVALEGAWRRLSDKG